MTDAINSTTLASGSDGPERLRIGLCLSGGGFRASAFGLGVVRYLVEAGLAADIQAVSAVSGGSVTAAMLAESWPAVVQTGSAALDATVVSRFVDVVSSKNLRNRGLVRFAGRRVTPGGRYGSARGTTLVRHLLDTERLAGLPPDLQTIITATDLGTGRAFRMSQEFVGSWDLKYAETPPTLGLATAIAASTAVPLMFPPIRLRTEGLDLATDRDLSLQDGGVYDNLGLEWFQGWSRGRPHAARECDFVVVVDASGPPSLSDAPVGWFRSVGRSQAAQYTQSRTSRIRWFVSQLLTGEMSGIIVPVGQDPRRYSPPDGIARIPDAADGALPDGFARHLARLRTDLDRFSVDELQLLMYGGYWSTHTRLRHLHPHLAVTEPAWREYADLAPEDANHLRGVLAAGAARRPFR